MDTFSPANGMLQFPLFQLCGGSQSQRADFLLQLQDGLDLRHLSLGIVDTSTPQRFELFSLVERHDLVVVEGAVDFPLHKIHMGSLHHAHRDDMIWHGEDDSIENFLENLLEKLERLALQVDVWACILIGGRSSRMGRPKHLLKNSKNTGESWLEHTVRLVEPVVDGLVISGAGEVPPSLASLKRIPDIPGVAGPLTGVLAAMRWQPGVSWLVIACDMPFITAPALHWILSRRRPGCWGRLPRLADADFCEPLFAWYDGRAAHLLEEQLLSGNLRVGKIASHLKIDNPIIPERLRSAWLNVNTPQQLLAVQPESAPVNGKQDGLS